MALYLVQHGISASKDADPERGLTEEGIEQTARMAQLAGNYGIGVTRIVHSGKNRAVQTADIFHRYLDRSIAVGSMEGIAPLDDVRTFAADLEDKTGWMVVGHLPFLQRLVSYLITGSSEAKVYQFQNSGIVCVESEKGEDESLKWFIKWTLNPTIS